MNEVESFLEELTALSQKYNIFIGGCGCCGSPFLSSGPGCWSNEIDEENLKYDEEKKRYVVEE